MNGDKQGNGKAGAASDRFPLPLPTSKDLRGRQSVRATFRLSEGAIQAISAVALHLGIKQKSLFDHLIDDARILEAVADEIRSEEFLSLERIQKTYVISRKTLTCLEATAKIKGTPRDALVEYSIQRLMPVIARERRRHRQRKQVLAEMSEYLRAGRLLGQKAADLLGEEDPVTELLEAATSAVEAAYRQVRELVRRGEGIEEL